jgi:hypothetical protein
MYGKSKSENTSTRTIPFGACSYCGDGWTNRDEFLGDPDLTIIGYQVHFRELTEGLFLFNHRCGGTLALPAKVFADLYRGPIFERRATGTDECPFYCLRTSELRPCEAQCECAYVRETIQLVKAWPKRKQDR